MDTEFPGEMKPEDTTKLRESSVERAMSNKNLLAPNCAIAAIEHNVFVVVVLVVVFVVVVVVMLSLVNIKSTHPPLPK